MPKQRQQRTAFPKAMTRFRLIAILMALTFLMSGLSACSSEHSLELRIDTEGGITSLDPQFTTDNLACTIIANTMEGLLTKDSEGKLTAAGAESWTLSPDGMTYTFQLRRDTRWSNDEPVTAADYIFSFRRIFDSQVPSPYAEEYIAIKNAAEVLSGQLPPSMLGVTATDDYSLKIELSEPSATFGERLADTAAVPCNEEFFHSTRARYGLAQDYLIFNGPYFVKSWNNDKSIVLRSNLHYREVVDCPGVVIYTNRIVPPAKAGGKVKAKSAKELFLEGKSDVYAATAQELSELSVPGTTKLEIENRVWQLVFNVKSETLENANIRRSLVMALDSGSYPQRVPEMYSIAESLIPKDAVIEGLKPPSLLPFSVTEARAAAELGKSELNDAITDKRLSIILPEGMGLDSLGSYIQRQWKEVLSLYVNMEKVSQEELKQRLENKKFTIALRQIDASAQNPASVLDSFSTGNLRNCTGWENAEFDLLLERAALAIDIGESAACYSEAEQIVIDNAVAVPILTQSSYFVFGKGVSGIAIRDGRMDFRKAVRIE